MKISLVVPITRWWALNQLFNCLERLEESEFFKEFHEQIYYIDTDDPRVIEGVKNYTDSKAKIVVSGNPAPHELRIYDRRDRITAMRNATRDHVSGDTDYVFSVEDDTIFPADAVTKLLNIARKTPNLGLASGVQAGRWGTKMIGAWRVNDVENPTKIISLPYTPYDYREEIDAAGMYCYITPTPLYKETEYHWEAPVGCDVAYGLDLRRKGLTNILDWSLLCGHNDFGKIIEIDENCTQVYFEKTDDWHQKELKRS